MIKTIKVKGFVWTIGLCFLVLLAFMFAGCSGNTDIGGARAGTGAFSMKVNWPDRVNKNDPALHLNPGGRFIPQGAQTIFISITGFGIAPGLPITSSISYPQTSVLIENIPAGAKVATIQALSGTTVLSQRKESFIISNGKTEQAGNIALGVAVKQSGTNIIFEPSYIEVTSGSNIPFQNWTSTSVTVTGEGINFALNAFSVDALGKITFDKNSVQPEATVSMKIQGYPSSVCTLYLPVGAKEAIAGGVHHTIALKENGEVWAWGYNAHGQLGDNTSGTNRLYPVRVKGENGAGFLNGIKAIACGGFHTIALKENGDVWAWGYNDYGQIGDNSTTKRLYPVRVTGENGVGFLTGIKAIAGGREHTIALKENGEVWAWGRNDYGQIGDNTSGTNCLYPVRVKGENGVGFLNGIKAIACGYDHTIALHENGEVWAWGYNSFGQLGNDNLINRPYPARVLNAGGYEFLKDIKVVACGGYHTIALKENGEVWTWGKNDEGQLGDNTRMNRKLPVNVKDLNGVLDDVKAIAGGAQYTIALNGDGKVSAWGYNFFGQLGDNTYFARWFPVRVKSENGVDFLTGVKVIAVSYTHLTLPTIYSV